MLVLLVPEDLPAALAGGDGAHDVVHAEIHGLVDAGDDGVHVGRLFDGEHVTGGDVAAGEFAALGGAPVVAGFGVGVACGVEEAAGFDGGGHAGGVAFGAGGEESQGEKEKG